jgi:uncharacterized phosphosugar-binding protein
MNSTHRCVKLFRSVRSLMPLNTLSGARYFSNEDTIYLTAAATAGKVSGDLSSSRTLAGLCGRHINVISAPYFASLQGILSQIAAQQADVMQQAGSMVAQAIAGGGVVHTFGSGHSHMIAEEAFFRAGGLAPVNPILDESLIFLHGAVESTRVERKSGLAQKLLALEDVRPTDAGIVVSNSGRNAAPIEMALGMKALGIKVIAITNPRQAATSPSRHASGKYLYEVVDLVIDNCIPVGDAVMELPGLSQKMGPSSTVAGAAIINAVMIEAAACLQSMGIKAPVISSANVGAGALEDIEAALAGWAPRVRLFAVHAQE